MRRVSCNQLHARINVEPSRSLSHLESFPPSSPLKCVLEYDLFKNKSCGCEGVRLEVSLTRATTPYSFTPNLASSGSYPLVGSTRPSYLRVHSSRYYGNLCSVHPSIRYYLPVPSIIIPVPLDIVLPRAAAAAARGA